MERGNEPNMMKVLNKMQKNEAQKNLLETTLMNNTLLKSRILSSLQPKIGRNFNYDDLEKQKEEKLVEFRRELLTIAIEEKNRELQTLKTQFIEEKEKMKTTNNLIQRKELLQRLETKSADTAKQLNKKTNKKVSFHLQQRTEIVFAKKKKLKEKKRKTPEHRKRKNRQNYTQK